MEDSSQEKLQQAENQFIEKLADNMHTFGVSSTVGRVLGIIYMNREPMTLDELSDKTGMSKTRMSQVVREMMELNIADKVFQKGVRKDLYNVENDYYQTFISLFTSNWRRAINKSRMFEKNLSSQLAEVQADETISEEAEEKVNELLRETTVWLDYYDWIYRLIEFFESGEIFEHVPKDTRRNHDA